MAHYALLNNANIVQKVITGVDENDTDNLPSEFHSWEEFYANETGYPKCKRTSYNTIANSHLTGGVPFRGNYAGIGHKYDEVNDVFIAPKPHDSWVLDSNWIWQAPIPIPTDSNFEKDTSLPMKSYTWADEVYVQDNTQGWVLTATWSYNSETEEWEKN